MNTVFADWAKALSKLQASVTKDLAEIRKQKAEIQQLKEDVYNRLSGGTYIHDDKRIVISAPEIIIGNADAGGMLYGDSGTVVIRGNSVSLEGAGEGGSVRTRAASISQLAVDPGSDGLQEAVLSNSTIVSQAKNIIIQSNDSEGFFAQAPQPAGTTGVRIHADNALEMEAAQPSETRLSAIKSSLSSLNTQKTKLTQASTTKMKSLTSLTAEMELLLQKSELLSATDELAIVNMIDLDDNQTDFENLSPAIHNAIDDCIRTMSQLAEVNRRITALKAEEKTLNAAKGSFKEKSTAARVSLNGEVIDIASKDGDGNIRTNTEATINMQTAHLNITTLKQDGSQIDNSSVIIKTKGVSIDTADQKLTDDTNGELTTVGSFHVRAKNMLFEAADYDLKDGKLELKDQTKDSSFVARVERTGFLSADKDKNTTGAFSVSAKTQVMGSTDKDGNSTGTFDMVIKEASISSTDKDKNGTGFVKVKAKDIDVASVDKGGKALGQVCINGKNVFVKAMDVNDKGADQSLASGGNMVLVAEKMFVGRSKKANTSKALTISSEKTGVFGSTTAEVQQGKAVVQLNGGKLNLAGSATGIYGDTTINAKSTFKGDVKMAKAKADNLEAGTSFKSPNISDGIAVPVPAAPASLSASLSEADAPEVKEVKSSGK